MVKKLLIAILSVVCVSRAQHVGLSAKTDSTNYRMGDWVSVRVEGNLSGEIESITPAFTDSIGSFEVIKIEKEKDKPRWLLTLMTLDSGNVVIPPIGFSYH